MSKIGHNAIGRHTLATDFRRQQIAGNVAVRNVSKALDAKQARATVAFYLASAAFVALSAVAGVAVVAAF